MEINFIILCLVAHIIGDYYLQDEEMANLKKFKIKGVFKHSIFYSIPYVAIFIFFEKSYGLTSLLVLLGLSHFIIDTIKYYSYKTYLRIFITEDKKNKMKKYIKPWVIYVLDQVVHIIVIIVLVIYFKSELNYPINIINKIYIMLNVDGLVIIKWVLMALCMHKPANITFRMIFSECKPSSKSSNNLNHSDNNSGVVNNGAIIGFLERIIIAIFLYLNQYSAIGFILTAKSIARYNKISEDAEFAEYYLIGTLFSTLFVIATYNIIF